MTFFFYLDLEVNTTEYSFSLRREYFGLHYSKTKIKQNRLARDAVLTEILKYVTFSSLEINLNVLKLVLYLSLYLSSSKFEAGDEIMAKEHQFQDVKMDFKTRNSSKKKVHG